MDGFILLAILQTVAIIVLVMWLDVLAKQLRWVESDRDYWRRKAMREEE